MWHSEPKVCVLSPLWGNNKERKTDTCTYTHMLIHLENLTMAWSSWFALKWKFELSSLNFTLNVITAALFPVIKLAMIFESFVSGRLPGK